MKAGQFINKRLKRLLKEKRVQAVLNTSRKRTALLANLSELLQLSYHRYVKEYHESRGFGSFLAHLLRILGLACDLAGTWLFWSTGIGMGMGLKSAGLAAKLIADLLATSRYRRHVVKIKKKQLKPPGFSLALEVVLIRLLAYMPWGLFEIIDYLRGYRKYHHALHRTAAQQAAKAFLILAGKQKEKAATPGVDAGATKE